MMSHRTMPLAVALFAAFTLNTNLPAQLVTIETVLVGDAGNAGDTRPLTGGYGSVADVFAIGKYEVTIGQYTAFLNSAAKSDPYGLYNTLMNDNPNIAGISRSGSDGSYSYSIIGPSGSTPPGASSPGNRPIAYVSWFDAARFANWVNNGATNGASTETGSYALNGATNGIFLAGPGATWVLPSEDQWYKAAYYKGGGTNAGYWLYPTRSDTPPGNTIGSATNQANYDGVNFSVTQLPGYDSSQNYLTDVGAFSNSASAYGTFDQGGNAWEWTDAVDGSSRGHRGGSWNNSYDTLESLAASRAEPTLEANNLGFRLAAVPEPSTYALALMGAGALWLWRRRKSALCRTEGN